MRNPGRTASTAAALMIGLALVTFVAVLANGMKASNRGAIEDQVKADYVVTVAGRLHAVRRRRAATPLAGRRTSSSSTSVRSELGKVAGSIGST